MMGLVLGSILWVGAGTDGNPTRSSLILPWQWAPLACLFEQLQPHSVYPDALGQLGRVMLAWVSGVVSDYCGAIVFAIITLTTLL